MLNRWLERKKRERKNRKAGRGSRKRQVRWRLWLRGWLQISTEGFPGCCLQLADHTLRGWRREWEDKDLASLSFSTQSLVLYSCVFTPIPEGIKVNMLAYPQLPRTGRALAAFISASLPSPLHFHPSLPSSPFPVIPLHLWCNLGFVCLARNTTAQICSVSPLHLLSPMPNE